MRAGGWVLLTVGIFVAAFGLMRADAAGVCGAGAGEPSAARCEQADHWSSATIAGAVAAFLGLALLVAPRSRGRIV